MTNHQGRRSVASLRGGWLDGLASEHTRDAYGRDLAAFEAWCEGEGQSPLHPAAGVERYRATWQDAEPATVARRLAALSSFYDHAVAEEAMASNPVDAVERPARSRTSTGSPLLEREALALFTAASRLGPKVAALVALLLFDGMKLGEALALDVDELDGSAWAMRASLARRGGVQVVPLDGRTAQAVAAYVTGRTTGPVFIGDSPVRGVEPAPRLSRFGGDFLLKRAAAVAGIDRKVSAGTLRHTYITLAHGAGASVEDIQRQVGHADARDTRRFLP